MANERRHHFLRGHVPDLQLTRGPGRLSGGASTRCQKSAVGRKVDAIEQGHSRSVSRDASLPVSTSQSVTTFPSPAEAKSFPSGENASCGHLGEPRQLVPAPEAGDVQMRTEPSQLPEASVVPSAEKTTATTPRSCSKGAAFSFLVARLPERDRPAAALGTVGDRQRPAVARNRPPY